MRLPKTSRTAARRALRLRQMKRRAGALVSSLPERRHLLQQGALALAAAVIVGGIYLTRGSTSAGPGETAAATPTSETSPATPDAASTSAGAPATADAAKAADQTPPSSQPAAVTETAQADAAPAAGSTAAPRPHFEVPPLEPEASEAKTTGEAATPAAPSAMPAAAGESSASPAGSPAKAPPSLSFRDDRALEPLKEQEATAASGMPAPAATAPAARPTVSFRDERALDSKPADSAPSTETAVAAPAAGTPLFRDERALDTKPRFSAPDALPAASFRDDRRLATPSFKDPRPADGALFQDTRPAAGVTFKDERALDAPAPASAPADGSGAPKAPEAGNSTGDRAPAARQPEQAASVQAQAGGANSSSAASVAAAPVGATPPAAPADGSLPTLVALAPGQLKLDGIACIAPEVTTEPLDGGLMRMRIAANCHPNEFVQISYGGAEFIRKLNSYGTLDYVLDCFAGSSSAVEVRFADGVTRQVAITAKDLDKVSKIAVVWRAGVNLDLHVFEYAAKFGENGHFWSGNPSGFVTAQVQGEADQRGHGFLSATDDDKTLGDKLEVYTFLHNDQQSAGAISLALDNATRGEMPSGPTCGQGALAEIGFQVSILPRNGQVTRQSGVLTRVECGTKLTHEARFNQSAMPGLRIRR